MWLSLLPSLLLLAQRAPRAVTEELSRDVMLQRSSAFVNDTVDFLQFPARCVPSHDLVYMQELPLHVHAAFTHIETLLTLKSLGGERMRAAVAQGVLKSWWAAAVPQLLIRFGSGDLFAALSKGEGVTSGLRKVRDVLQTKSILLSLGTRRSARCNGCVQVDDSMKTHKNPELRASGVVADKAPVVAATAAAAKAPAVVKPPRFELQDKKWVVENQVRVARVWLLLACRLCDTCGRWIIRRWRLTTATSSKPCTFRTALARPTAPCCRSRQAPRSISAEEKILPPLTHAFTGEDQGQQHHDRRLQKDVPRRAQVCLPHTPPPCRIPHPLVQRACIHRGRQLQQP